MSNLITCTELCLFFTFVKKSFKVFSGQIYWYLEDTETFYVERGRCDKRKDTLKKKRMKKLKRQKRKNQRGRRHFNLTIKYEIKVIFICNKAIRINVWIVLCFYISTSVTYERLLCCRHSASWHEYRQCQVQRSLLGTPTSQLRS